MAITFSKLGRHGQLGNQLFQYAILLGVKAKHGFDIVIPKNFTGKKKVNLVELDRLEITAGTLHGDGSNMKEYREATFAFDPMVLEQPDNTNYVGYFQTEKYFQHAEELVRKEFTFRDDIETYARLVTENRRKDRPLVAVHVRRGDYVQHSDMFQVLTPDYYWRAFNHPELRQWGKLDFLVFSDDLHWCKQNLKADNIAYIQSPSHWHDLAIMTYCDHHIISAGSFGWWGAWLCKGKNNTVIAPTPWFPPKRTLDTKDILPTRWHTQEV